MWTRYCLIGLSLLAPSQWATSCCVFDHTAGRFGTQLSKVAQPYKTDVVLIEKIAISSRSNSASFISTCSHFFTRGFHPFSSSTPTEYSWGEWKTSSWEQKQKDQTMNGRRGRDLSIYCKYYNLLLLQKSLSYLAAILESPPGLHSAQLQNSCGGEAVPAATHQVEEMALFCARGRFQELWNKSKLVWNQDCHSHGVGVTTTNNRSYSLGKRMCKKQRIPEWH